jgi:hypothetical protein
MRQWELAEKQMEEERDAWFAQARPMANPKKTWREKHLAREDNGTDSSEGQGEYEIGEGNGTTKEDEPTTQPSLDINMVFVIPEEFRAPETKIVELCTGVERAVFERPPKLAEHMKPSYIRGHLDGVPVGRMRVDGGASINIMHVSLFEKLDHQEKDLKRTNVSLSRFSGDPAKARGIVSKELTVGSKTVPTAFFIVDLRG